MSKLQRRHRTRRRFLWKLWDGSRRLKPGSSKETNLRSSTHSVKPNTLDRRNVLKAAGTIAATLTGTGIPGCLGEGQQGDDSTETPTEQYNTPGSDDGTTAETHTEKETDTTTDTETSTPTPENEGGNKPVYNVEVKNDAEYKITADSDQLFGTVYAPSPYSAEVEGPKDEEGENLEHGLIETSSTEPDFYSKGFTENEEAVLFYDKTVREHIGRLKLLVYTLVTRDKKEKQFYGEIPEKYISEPKKPVQGTGANR